MTGVELRFGYTLADVHAISRLAVHTAGAMASNWHDRYETAWSGVVEVLYAAEHWMPRPELVRAGQLAIYAAVTADRHHHGYYKHKTVGASAGACSSPAFITYWLDVCGMWPTQSCEPGVVDRMSLSAILPVLTPQQRTALFALAAHDTYQDAARAVGMTQGTFTSHISHARRRFLALWHEGEMPSKPWGCDRRAGVTAGTRRVGSTPSSAIRRRRRAAEAARDAT